MAITVEDEAVIERHLNERYVLVPRDVRWARRVSLGYAIIALALAEIIVVMIRAGFVPMCAEFEVPLSIVSKLAFGLWLPVTLASVIFVTLARQFVPRLSQIAYTWNLVAFWAAIAAAALSVVGGALACLSLLQCLS